MINAQVTAVISLIESISNIIFIIVIWITVRRTYLLTIQNMIMYMVVIPYTFLMNTSDNKNRVLEYGWRNVFQNLLGRKNNRRISPREASNNNLRTAPKKVKLKTISGVDVPDRLFTTENIGAHESTFYGSLDDEATTSNGTKSRKPKIVMRYNYY